MTKEEREVMRMALKALENLHATVWGECPSLLNEDSGGDSFLDMDCKDAITAIEKCLANDALEKKAENARDLGISYD